MNLFVSNISAETTEADLREVFSEFGDVVSVKVIKDPATGMSRGFGFVEMADRFSALESIDNLDCTYLKGQIINVKEARPKTPTRNNNRRGGDDDDFQQRRRFNRN